MARVSINQIVRQAEQLAAQGQGETESIIGRRVGEMIEQLLKENPKAGLQILEILEKACEDYC